MPARKVHLGAACLEARVVNELLQKCSQVSSRPPEDFLQVIFGLRS